jgi:hypothetical protein
MSGRRIKPALASWRSVLKAVVVHGIAAVGAGPVAAAREGNEGEREEE